MALSEEIIGSVAQRRETTPCCESIRKQAMVTKVMTKVPEKSAGFPRLLVIDLDGTSLGGGYEPYARFPEPVAVFLDALDEAGCDWAINTTWDVNGQWQMILNSSLRSRPKFFVAELGRRVARLGDNGPEFVQPYTDQVQEQLEKEAEEHLLPFAREITSRYVPATMHYYGHGFSFQVLKDADAFDRWMNQRVTDFPGLRIRQTPGQVSAWLDFLNKRKGLAEVLRVGGYSPDEVVAIGDELEDVYMMDPACAAHAICPANAAPKVKEHVKRLGGVVASRPNGEGIIEGFKLLAAQHGWTQFKA